jgi:hypothetical protein
LAGILRAVAIRLLRGEAGRSQRQHQQHDCHRPDRSTCEKTWGG